MALYGPFSVRVVVDANSRRRTSSMTQRAIGLAADQAITRLGVIGVGHMRRLERGMGRNRIAASWTMRKLPGSSMGRHAVEIYNELEDRLLYNVNGATGKKDSRYPVEGEDVLKFLEYGTKSHFIRPRDKNGWLVFGIRSGIKRSDFGGTVKRSGGYAHKAWGPVSPTEIQKFKRVRHPGFPGSRHLRLTRALLLRDANSVQLRVNLA